MMSPKENYLAVMTGKMPDFVPRSSFGPRPGDPRTPTNWRFTPPILEKHRENPAGGKDIWGVNYVPTYETGNAMLPEPNNFILKDIRKWRDVIKAPDLSGVDWPTMIKNQLDKAGIDRSKTLLSLGLHFGYFQLLMSFMGFSEGLVAMYEEPDEVKDLMNYVCDFYMEIGEKVIDIYKPDVLNLTDDTAAWKASFISADMYREFLVPNHDRWAKMGRDRGLVLTMHNCGKCEDVVDEFVKMGVTVWDPAQTSNDILAIKAKYGRKLCIAGAWDPSGRLLEPDTTEEEIRASVLETMETYAIGGGFMWAGAFLGPLDDPNTQRKNNLLGKAIDEIGADFYKTH